MGDTLLYRIPNSPKIQLNGNFEESLDLSDKLGFVLSSFDNKKKFHFKEANTLSKYHYHHDVKYCISKEEYFDSARFFLDGIRSKEMGKAILSRIKKNVFEGDIMTLFNSLCETYPETFVYLISSPLFGTWIGASPEVLLQTFEGKAKTVALAGTMPSNSDAKWSQKEIGEQLYVKDFVFSNLSKLGVKDVAQSEDFDAIAGPVKHLKTEFEFSLGNYTPFDIIEALHPTPAVAGFPQEQSLNLISEAERHERFLYAGYIGVIGHVTSSIFVNLRCAQLTENEIYLYLGGGFTADSSIDEEWRETENKAKTILNVIENL